MAAVSHRFYLCRQHCVCSGAAMWKDRLGCLIFPAGYRAAEVNIKRLLMVFQVANITQHDSLNPCSYFLCGPSGGELYYQRSALTCAAAPLLPPPGLVLVVGIVNGVLDPQTFSFLHVWTLLSQGHGLPGFYKYQHHIPFHKLIHNQQWK